MTKILITSAAPFEFADGACLISFTHKDVIDDNRERGLSVWSPRLLDLEKAGYIKIIERPDLSNVTPEPVAEVSAAEAAKPESIKARPGRKPKAVK